MKLILIIVLVFLCLVGVGWCEEEAKLWIQATDNDSYALGCNEGTADITFYTDGNKITLKQLLRILRNIAPIIFDANVKEIQEEKQ